MAENVKHISINNDYLGSGDADQYGAAGIPTIDIRNGGQWGLLPVIGGIDNDTPIHEWMHNQRYQRRDIIPIVLSVPRGFDLLPNKDSWKQAVKAMMEVHAKTIKGLDSSLTVTNAETDLGMSGAKFREATQVVRASSSVSISLEEKAGIPFEILLDVWIRYFIEDPDLGAPLITRIAAEGSLPFALTPDYKTMTVLFIEPDEMFRKPVHAWLVSNLYPDKNPGITGEKDKTTARSFKNIELDMGGFAIPSTNKRVMKLATTMLKKLELWTRDPEEIRLPAESVEASIASENIDLNIKYEGAKQSK